MKIIDILWTGRASLSKVTRSICCSFRMQLIVDNESGEERGKLEGSTSRRRVDHGWSSQGHPAWLPSSDPLTGTIRHFVTASGSAEPGRFGDRAAGRVVAHLQIAPVLEIDLWPRYCLTFSIPASLMDCIAMECFRT